MMSWGGFSAKARATRTSPLQKLYDGQATLSPLVSIAEHTAGGLMPAVQSDGFRRPDRVDLIDDRPPARPARVAADRARIRHRRRTAAETGRRGSAVARHGRPAPSNTTTSLRELGTGLCINNLWYLNFSDRMNCRLTGMTRFATFWVENGEAVAPTNVMRFDDSVYRILGDQLTGLTATREFIPESRDLRLARHRQQAAAGRVRERVPPDALTSPRSDRGRQRADGRAARSGGHVACCGSGMRDLPEFRHDLALDPAVDRRVPPTQRPATIAARLALRRTTRRVRPAAAGLA